MILSLRKAVKLYPVRELRFLYQIWESLQSVTGSHQIVTEQCIFIKIMNLILQMVLRLEVLSRIQEQPAILLNREVTFLTSTNNQPIVLLIKISFFSQKKARMYSKI